MRDELRSQGFHPLWAGLSFQSKLDDMGYSISWGTEVSIPFGRVSVFKEHLFLL